jgi:hypothetical protein
MLSLNRPHGTNLVLSIDNRIVGVISFGPGGPGRTQVYLNLDPTVQVLRGELVDSKAVTAAVEAFGPRRAERGKL